MLRHLFFYTRSKTREMRKQKQFILGVACKRRTGHNIGVTYARETRTITGKCKFNQ